MPYDTHIIDIEFTILHTTTSAGRTRETIASSLRIHLLRSAPV